MARVESFFAPSVKRRVELRDTWSRTTGRMGGRGWITLDGEEIGCFEFQPVGVGGQGKFGGVLGQHSAKQITKRPHSSFSRVSMPMKTRSY